MRAFIQCDKITHLPFNPNAFNAYYGLLQMGFECVFFETYEELMEHFPSRSELVVGGIGIVRKRLLDLEIPCDEINYPEELKRFLHRNIWESTINTVRDHPETWPVFVKSVEGKRLTGKVISHIRDLVGCGCSDEDYPVLCSNPINFVSEWRVFVRYGNILDIRPYYGDFTKFYDPEQIRMAITEFKTAPNAYGIDFGVTDRGDTVLIEVNDAYSLGCYGLPALTYAKFLLTRWAELTDTLDEFWYL